MRVTVYHTSEFAAKTSTAWTYNNIKQRFKCMLSLGCAMMNLQMVCQFPRYIFQKLVSKIYLFRWCAIDAFLFIYLFLL